MDTGSFIEVSWWHVAACGLMLIAVLAVILLLKLELSKPLFISSVRCFVQLTLVGFILDWAFGPGHPSKIGLIILVMVAIAAYTAVSHQKWRHKSLHARVFASLCLSLLLTMIPLDILPFLVPAEM